MANKPYLDETGAKLLTDKLRSEIAEGDAKSIPAPEIARVGQFLKVTAVDENGKPTEWETVGKPNYTAAEVGADASGTAENKVASHNVSPTAHNDIRLLIDGLTSRLNALANSDDVTLDQMAEVVTYIKSNKSLIEAVTTSKVNVSDVIDNLTTNATDKPLSAAQGVALKALIDAIEVGTGGAFIVKISAGDNDTYTADKTYAEISEAVERGDSIILEAPAYMYDFVFPWINIRYDYMGQITWNGATGHVFHGWSLSGLVDATSEADRDGLKSVFWAITEDNYVGKNIEPMSLVNGLSFTRGGEKFASFDGHKETTVEIPEGALVVGFTDNGDGTATVDKTYAEIKAAADAGRYVYANLDNGSNLLSCVAADEFGVTFAFTFVSAGVITKALFINPDDSNELYLLENSSSSLLVVNISAGSTNGTYTADKTFAEITEAINSGRPVVARWISVVMPLVGASDDDYSFAFTVYDSDERAIYTWMVSISNQDAVTVKVAAGNVGYTLPTASPNTLGGIKADPAQETDTQPVRIGADGKLVTAASSGGGGKELYSETVFELTVEEEISEMRIDVTSELEEKFKNMVFCTVYANIKKCSEDDATTAGMLSIGMYEDARDFWWDKWINNERIVPINAVSYIGYYELMIHTIKPPAGWFPPSFRIVAPQNQNQTYGVSYYKMPTLTTTNGARIRMTSSIPLGVGSTIKIKAYKYVIDEVQ